MCKYLNDVQIEYSTAMLRGNNAERTAQQTEKALLPIGKKVREGWPFPGSFSLLHVSLHAALARHTTFALQEESHRISQHPS